jgi:collagen type VII alpha
MGSGMVSFDDDPRRWADADDDDLNPTETSTAWSAARPGRSGLPPRRPGHSGSSVAAQIRAPVSEPEPADGLSDGALAMVAVAAGVSVVAVIGVGIVGIGIVAASLARPPAIDLGVSDGIAMSRSSVEGDAAPRRVAIPDAGAGPRGPASGAPVAGGGWSDPPAGAAGAAGGGWSDPPAGAAGVAGTTPRAQPAGSSFSAAPASASSRPSDPSRPSDLSRPSDPSLPAPPEDDSWLGGMVSAGTEMVAKVLGTSTEPPPTLSSVVEPRGPAPAGAASAATAPGGPTDLLAGDDGLDDLTDGLAAERSSGWTTASAADDAAMALLAELDAPSGQPPAGSVPGTTGSAAGSSGAGSSGAWSSAAGSSGAAAPGPSLAEVAAETRDGSDDGWFDSVLSAGAGIASAVMGGSSPPAAPPARVPPAGSPSLADTIAPPSSGSAARGPSLAAALGASPSTSPSGATGASGPTDLLAGGDDGLSDIGRSADRTDGFGSAASPDDAAMALLAELDADQPTRSVMAPGTAPAGAPGPSTAAPPPPGPAEADDDAGWLDSVIDVGSSIRSFVTGEPAPTAPPGGVAPPPQRDPSGMALPSVPDGTSGTSAARLASGGSSAAPGSAAAPGSPDLPLQGRSGPVDLLAGDDGLDDFDSLGGGADRTDGFGTAAAPDDAAMALLAELDDPPPKSSGDSWFDTVASVGSAISDGLSSMAGGGGGSPRSAPAVAPATTTTTPAPGGSTPALDGSTPALDGLVADLATERPTARPVQVGDQSLAALDQFDPSAPSAARPSAEDEGWFDSMLGAGTTLVSRAMGASDEGLKPEPPRRPVDLLAGDDGLDDLGPAGATDRTGGFASSSAADDPAMQLLAELDRPSPRPAASTSLASVLGPTADPSAARPATGSTAAGSSATGAAFPPPPEVNRDDSWLDSITTQVASLVGAPSSTSAARPSPVAPATTRQGPQVDLLAGDDGLAGGLDALVADLGRDSDGWQRGSAPDDAALAILAELDAPSAPRPASPGPSGSAAAPPAAAAPAESAGWFDSVVAAGSALASYVAGEDEPATGTAGGTPSAPAASRPSLSSIANFLTAEPVPTAPSGAPPPRPTSRSAGRSVDLLADGDDNLRAVGSDPTASKPVDEWVNPMLAPDPMAGTSDDAAVATGVAGRSGTAAACNLGELCDQELRTYRDSQAQDVDLLAGDDDLFFGPLQDAQPAVAELFYDPSEDLTRGGGANGLFSMRDFLLIVNTDVPGVPVEIDGRAVGDAPLVTEVPPGAHQVRLYGGGDAISEFTLRVDADPQEWCFQSRGRQFKYVRCP